MRRALFALAHLEILTVCGVLLGAFWMQFVLWEYPCPLCILQRMAMFLCLMGPALILFAGLRRDDVDSETVLTAFGMRVTGAVIGLVASMRQILLHILPGDPGYGPAVLGLHLYTWAFLVFLVLLACSGLGLLASSTWRPRAWPASRRWSRAVLWLVGAMLVANALAVFAQAGFHLYLPDNPTSYRLFS